MRDVDLKRAADLNNLRVGIGKIDATTRRGRRAPHPDELHPELEFEFRLEEIGVIVKRTSIVAAAVALAAVGVRRAQ
jgi:hypothetical protein